MNLLAAMLVLAASGALAASAVLHLVHRPVLAWLRQTAPGVRIHWILVALGAPMATGLGTVLIAFGPCIHNLLLGLVDGCRDHGGPDVFLCLRLPMRDLPGAWAVAILVVTVMAHRLLRGTFVAISTQRALSTLRRLGSYDRARDIWLVPGDLAVVSGWPTSRVYVGEDLERTSSPCTFRVVLAHERAHVRRHDVGIKLFARLLGLGVPRHLREHLLSELGLAMEQACDASAANELHDPLAVARSLLELARTQVSTPALGLACVPPAEHLEARIRALCAPSWAPSRGIAALMSAALLATAAVCLTYDPTLHDLVEAAFDRLLT